MILLREVRPYVVVAVAVGILSFSGTVQTQLPAPLQPQTGRVTAPLPAAPAPLQPLQPPPPPPAPAPLQAPTSPFTTSAICKQSCAGAVAGVTFALTSPSGVRTCPASPQVVHPCAPFACAPAGLTCRARCDTNADCSQGYFCSAVTHQCGPLAYTCSQSQFIKGTDGSSVDCAPYKCAAGRCQTSCSSVNDCIAPTVCDSSRQCIIPTR